MRPDITTEILSFMDEARIAFNNNKELKTWRNTRETLIALRREVRPFSDDIEIYELGGYVGNFTGQIERVDRDES